MKISLLLSNLFCPKKCVFCNKALSLLSCNSYCNECADTLAVNTDRVCNVCGKPLHTPRGELLCENCKKKPKSFNRNVSAFVYKDKVRDAIVKMKFSKNQQWIAVALGELLSKKVEEEYSYINFDGVIFVPISKRREISRGFNQAEIIAEVVAKKINVPLIKNVLVKDKNNKRQSELKAVDRVNNVKGVYGLKFSEVEDKTLLLIDDVFTTGATLNECSKVLKRAGALFVYCATVSITERGNRFCGLKKNSLNLKKF